MIIQIEELRKMIPNVPTCPPPAPPPLLNGCIVTKTKSKKPADADSSLQLSAEYELTSSRDRLWELEGWKDAPLLTVYRYLRPIIQDGPQCGIVALAMATASTENPTSVSSLLGEAKARGYSFHGEMFSVDNMADLARSVLPQSRIKIIEGLVSNRDSIVHDLARGGILLVPYDADRNHEPCCRRGHKAHWGAVSGALVCSNRCLLAARQGKSRRLMLWDYGQLAASNDNLCELSPKRSQDGNDYLLPEGGVKAGLCGRAVLLMDL